ncbi:binding-protein-dependent transport systems inner membrane component [Alkaliphilus metalliredigens QYMF]|uniref:Binding-protein-dependent transport systems inner membrane component n=1 Tax=Alkaliphilus metalliredigens (strain QYMF) TaxID=293826 RepID=A6TPT1_ALKMQ|nr:ABC transporter permease [Alkaliphilus metalliredigens]ABR48199.1 binding-protein-dependent transport systems inner membrane component [Alkaliphilus metalliredigens QYMF]
MNKVIDISTNRKMIWKLNRRQRTIITTGLAATILIAIILGGIFSSNEKIQTYLQIRNLSPSLQHPFGTDWLGRDMFTRTIKGLTLSLGVGMLAATSSLMVALVLGMMAATMGRKVDAFVSWLVDLFLSVPHLVALILIAFALGGGMRGVVLGVTLTHWPSLTRVIRAEVMQLRNSEFVEVSRQFGKSSWWIATRHILPHLIPQFFVGLVLLFPHAVLHEAAITFLGFGLSPHQPAIGIILSESMRYLSTGMWWLAFFPGLSLLVMVRAFDILGENLHMLMNPHRGHE